MVDVDPHADAGLSLTEAAVQGGHRGLFQQGDQARRGQCRDLAGSQGDGRVGIGDGKRGQTAQPRHRGHSGTLRIRPESVKTGRLAER